jgi:hypothetical protein
LRSRFRHPDQVFEILISLPLLFIPGRHLAGRGSFRLVPTPEPKVGSAVKTGLSTGIEFPETQFQDFWELLLGPDLRCQIVRKAQSDRGHLPEV